VGRYFVAVRPPETVMDEIEALPRPERQGVRWTRRHQWHVTLAFLGDIDEGAVAAALGEVDAPVTRVDLGPEVELIRDHVIVVPVSGLDDLADAVQAVVRPLAPDMSTRRFRGHLTLARCRSGPPDGIVGRPVSTGFDVTEFALVSSELDPGGARHHEVASYPLAGRLDRD
jgi:2'-5' RNA ligase